MVLTEITFRSGLYFDYITLHWFFLSFGIYGSAINATKAIIWHISLFVRGSTIKIEDMDFSFGSVNASDRKWWCLAKRVSGCI